MIEQDIRAILVSIKGLEEQVAAIEKARVLARDEQDDWRDEIREDIREIKAQVTATNGSVRKHDLILAHIGGVASVFSWWKAAAATVVGGSFVAAVAYFLTTL